MEKYNNKAVLEKYYHYLETKSEEAAIVFIVQNLVDSLDTKKKWIDVVDFDTYGSRVGKMAFNYIIVELFERKIHPKYPKGADAKLKKAITWKTAHEDMMNQRSNGIKGTLFLITCKLFNKNKGKQVTRLLPHWNEEYGGFDYTGKVPTTTIARKFDMEPEWHYKITGTQKINKNQFRCIQENYDNEIYPRIIHEQFVKIDWFLEKYN